MGYRSDVGLALTQAPLQTLNQKLNALDKTSEAFSVITDFFTYADKHFEDTESGAEVYLWEYVKWYEEFPDVGFVEKLLAELDWSDYLFIRIGEELEDIDTRGSFWDNPFDLGISRSIILSTPTD